MKPTELLNNNNKLDLLESEIRKQGYRGKADIPKLIYLTGISRHFDQPVNCVVFGPSGGGKSFSVNAGLQFIHPKGLISVTGMTDQFLSYAKNTDFKHKVLFLGEAAGMAEGPGRVNLRQFLTEGVVKRATVQKNDRGQMVGEITEAAVGPTAFIMTTTAGGIHHEDQSRMLALEISEDRERVKEALLAQAHRKTPQRVELDLQAWHELDEIVEKNPKDVTIPYAKCLAELMPTDRQKIIRDFPKVLALIDAHALIHQSTRDRGKDGEVIASEFDYEVVYDLAAGYLKVGLEHDVNSSVKEVVNAVANSESGKRHGTGLSQPAITALVNQERSTVCRNINKAVFLGYLRDKNPGQGRESEIVLGDRELSESDVLPHPDELFGRKPIECRAVVKESDSKGCATEQQSNTVELKDIPWRV